MGRGVSMSRYKVFISETHPVVNVYADRVEVRTSGTIVFYELLSPKSVRVDVDDDERIVAIYPSTTIVELVP